jgi:hypothetical protein
MRKNFISQVYDLKEKSYNDLKETNCQNMKMNNFHKFYMQNYYINKRSYYRIFLKQICTDKYILSTGYHLSHIAILPLFLLGHSRNYFCFLWYWGWNPCMHIMSIGTTAKLYFRTQKCF